MRYPYHQPGNIIMNMIQNLMERLRPLLGLKGWDYCAFWRLSDDQRYMELMGNCCCGGTESSITTENGGSEELQFPVSPIIPCRDFMFQHTRTKSCELLAQLPSSIPLDNSGIHAHTLMSNIPIWLNIPNTLDSTVLGENVGTRALVPVPRGLLELFVSKQVPEDQYVIDFVTSQCNFLLEQEAMINSSTNMDSSFSSVNVNVMNHETQSKPFLADHDHDHDHDPDNEQEDHIHDHFKSPMISPSAATALDNLNQLPYDHHHHHINIDRIFPCASPLNFMNHDHQFDYNNEEHKTKNDHDVFFDHGVENNGVQDMDALQKSMMGTGTTAETMHMQFMESLTNNNNKQQENDHKESIKQKNNGPSDDHSLSDCNDQIDDHDDDSKYRRRNGKGPQSKNLMAERKRRRKLNDRLYSLRALVPNITKLDRASILGDAIDYVKELQKQAKELQDELEEHEGDEGAKNGSNVKNIPPDGVNPLYEPTLDHGFQDGASGKGNVSNQSHKDSEITHDKGHQMEAQVEVAQLHGNEFFVKVFCEHKPGGFVRLMEALDSLGLEVTNANVTSNRGLVSNVFQVEKKDSEMVQADYVRDSLLELTRIPPREWAEMTKASENCTGMEHHHHHHHSHEVHHHLHNDHINISNHHHQFPHL